MRLQRSSLKELGFECFIGFGGPKTSTHARVNRKKILQIATAVPESWSRRQTIWLLPRAQSPKPYSIITICYYHYYLSIITIILTTLKPGMKRMPAPSCLLPKSCLPTFITLRPKPWVKGSGCRVEEGFRAQSSGGRRSSLGGRTPALPRLSRGLSLHVYKLAA